MRFLLKWALMVVALILSGVITSIIFRDFRIKFSTGAELVQLFIAVAAIAVLNATIGKILKLLTLPFNCLTFGLVGLCINAAIFLFAGSLGLGFQIDSFITALVGSAVYSAIGSALSNLVADDKNK
ncbi:MAG: phage holin family protein [Armatimonadetes bacterium]|nr:phage holin family protein [Armatimonadota bacterium]